MPHRLHQVAGQPLGWRHATRGEPQHLVLEDFVDTRAPFLARNTGEPRELLEERPEPVLELGEGDGVLGAHRGHEVGVVE